VNIFKSLFGADSGTQVAAGEAKTWIDGDDTPFILDVRQPDEFRAGHIPGARVIPLGELSSRQGELPRNRTILCVCRSGARSGVAARQLRDQGLSAVNLRGGMIAWQSAGYTIRRGK
jgi:rhodanese-related sulfurtransferase